MRRSLILVSVALLCACASWRRKGLSVSPPRKIRVAVLPLELDFKVKRPEDLETVVSTGTTRRRREEGEALKAALARSLGEDFALRVSSSYLFTAIRPVDVESAMESLGLSTAAAASESDYPRLARALGADALLRVRVHGYGRVKASWLWMLWGSSFGEGAAQGVIVAEAAANVWAAAAVAAEEVAQEGVEWFGGGYLFDRYYAPVVLEGDLYAANGRKLWGRWFVVTRNKRAVKRLPDAERRKKQARLLLTFDKARDELMRSLEKAALKNVERS